MSHDIELTLTADEATALSTILLRSVAWGDALLGEYAAVIYFALNDAGVGADYSIENLAGPATFYRPGEQK